MTQMVGHKQKIWFFLRLCGQFGCFFYDFSDDVFWCFSDNSSKQSLLFWLSYDYVDKLDDFLTIIDISNDFFWCFSDNSSKQSLLFWWLFPNIFFWWSFSIFGMFMLTWRLNTLFKDVLALDRSCFSVRIDFTFSKRFLNRQKFVKF